MYQSIQAWPSPRAKPRALFLIGEFPTPQAIKEFKTPTTLAYKTRAKTPPPVAFSSNITKKKQEKMRQKSCKTASFIIFRWLKDKLGLQVRPPFTLGKFTLINVNICPYL